MKNFKFLFAFAFFFIVGASSTVNAQDKAKVCREAVDKHYDDISDEKNIPSAHDREVWKAWDELNCKHRSNRRDDGHLKHYSVANSRRKDKKKDDNE